MYKLYSPGIKDLYTIIWSNILFYGYIYIVYNYDALMTSIGLIIYSLLRG